MSGHFRKAGGRIDRSQTLRFIFDGIPMSGHPGDTLASALIANGVHFVGRSFKYHRPRGILAAGAEEPNALVTLNRGEGRVTPNLRATQVELYEGLEAESQNRWPSLGLDIGALNVLISPFIGAGFYYKTFFGPGFAKKRLGFLSSNWAWAKLYEPFVRRAAGLGDAPEAPDPDRYSQRFAHCDVLVAGGGLAGLRAAHQAAEAGERVILCDEQVEFGGWALTEGGAALAEITARLADLRGRPNVRLLTRTQAFGYYPHNLIGLVERCTDHLAAPVPEAARERLWQVRAKEVVIATGAIERPLVFDGNDKPGVMLAGAVETYLARYGVAAGSRIVVATACNSAYGVALALAKAGIAVSAILDLRAAPETALVEAARAAGIAVETGATIIRAKGGRQVSGITWGRITEAGVVPVGEIACDCLAMSGGWTPSIHLAAQARSKPVWNEGLQAFLAGDVPPGQNFRMAGLAAGEMPPEMAGAFSGACPSPVPPETVKAFVDFQNDVTARDIRLATREGLHSIEHVKRYTTTGMATDQGKTSNLNALAIAAEALAKPLPAVGLTTYRAPYTPVTFGAFAGVSRGQAFEPIRKTPMHEAAEACGAVFQDTGLWKRARVFPLVGESREAAIARECRVVRERVGLFDASTLGKIAFCGPDAAEALERLYAMPIRKLGIGRCRYGIMLSEAGVVIDDGVIVRLAEDRFHVTTTSGGAPHVFAHNEDYLQTEWPVLKAWQVSVTEQWAVAAVQGPLAREALAPLCEGFDLSGEAFPHMAMREGRVAGIPAMVMRVSFTGEMGYEINVPASQGPALWAALLAEVERLGGAPYGLDAMHILRAEKGYIIVGQETDGTVTLDDLGLSGMIGKTKGDFIGKRGMQRSDLARDDRKQLVGLRPKDRARVPEEGAQVVARRNALAGTPALGHVTSAYHSAACAGAIALALVADGRARMGDTVWLTDKGGDIEAKIVAPIFLDPKGERLHG